MALLVRLTAEGIRTLKWPIKDDNNNKIDLYVLNAPMGLLCHKEVAQFVLIFA
jgi:hypothetical protein